MLICDLSQDLDGKVKPEEEWSTDESEDESDPGSDPGSDSGSDPGSVTDSSDEEEPGAYLQM